MHLSSAKPDRRHMKPAMVDPIEIALREDIGEGDVTTDFFVSKNQQATARIVARERAILAGTETTAEVFRRVDSALDVAVLQKDGSELNDGDNVIQLRGQARSILKAERVALNFLQRLSGIATLTRKFVNAAANDRVKILDTRKTTPGLRALEKAAVLAGGGANHRFGLFDMVMVKDNHIAAETDLARLQEAIRRCKADHPDLRIELEADTVDQVRRFLTLMG